MMAIMIVFMVNHEGKKKKEIEETEPWMLTAAIVFIVSWLATISIFILLFMTLSAVFVCKLKKVNQEFDKNELLPTIVKISLLSFVWIISFVVCYFLAIVLMWRENNLHKVFAAMIL